MLKSFKDNKEHLRKIRFQKNRQIWKRIKQNFWKERKSSRENEKLNECIKELTSTAEERRMY